MKLPIIRARGLYLGALLYNLAPAPALAQEPPPAPIATRDFPDLTPPTLNERLLLANLGDGWYDRAALAAVMTTCASTNTASARFTACTISPATAAGYAGSLVAKGLLVRGGTERAPVWRRVG